MNANQRLIERIDAALDLPGDKNMYGSEDEEVLMSIKRSLSPAGLARRDEWDQSVTHLHEVANQRLKPYENLIQARQELSA